MLLMVEGTIGAGKSTFVKLIAERIGAVPLYEPHMLWQKYIGGASLLELFYKDPYRWAYTFQNYAYQSRIIAWEEVMQKYSATQIFLAERSMFSDYYCFARNAYQKKFMSDLEWELYTQEFRWWVARTPAPAGFIYLHLSIERAYERVVRRGRREELGVGREYLAQLHTAHEQLLCEQACSLMPQVPVLILDVERDFEFDPMIQMAYAKKIAQTFNTPMFFDIPSRDQSIPTML